MGKGLWMDGCGVIHKMGRLKKLPIFPSAKADMMPNSCNAGGFFLGSCPFRTTRRRRNYQTEPLSRYFLSEKVDI